MKKYTILEHTADIMLEIYGENLQDLFSNAALAMCEQVVDPDKVEFKDAVADHQFMVINLKSPFEDLEKCLQGFLSEVKTMLYEYRLYPVSFDWANIHSVRVYYKNMKSAVFCDEIKAVTYNEMDIKKEDGIWKTRVVFDV